MTPARCMAPLRAPALRAGAPVLILLTCAVLALPAGAQAEFSGASLLSGTSELQFEHAEAPAFARDGGYVSFEGSLAGVSGVWRRDLHTGAIEAVAVSESGEEATSTAPSISADGRYIAFTTTADLEPEHTDAAGDRVGEPATDAGCPEVYVRDMDRAPGEEGAYTLASALEHGEGIMFQGSCPPGGGGEGGFALAGAQTAPGVALSADGRSVAFTVLSPSNLATGVGGATTTPASQVAVRDLEAQTTTLVSVEPDGQPTPGGGAFPSEASEARALTIGSSQIGDQITGSTAAISGDGDTVAWLGTNVPAQVPGSGPEIESAGEAGLEAEPLWRRVAGGEAAITRRLLANAGLDFFFVRNETLEKIRDGSFVADTSGQIFVPPVLSEDGNTVALISNAPRPAAVRGVEFGEQFPPQSDAYAVHIDDEPAAVPQVIPLTETPDYDTKTGAEGFIKDIAISPDGNRIAFDSERNQFTLPALALISPPATSKVSQTYEANLALQTLQRVTVTYDGAEPTGGGAGLLSFSGADGALAFASGATNLFYGDAVDASQIYMAEEVPSEQSPATESNGPVPLEPLPQLEWRLDATVNPQRDGSVTVHVLAPGAGVLTVRARAEMPEAAKTSPGVSSNRARHKGGRSSVGGPLLATRTIARAVMTEREASSLSIDLRAAGAYRSEVASKRGLYAVLNLAYTASGHNTLTAQIPVTFHRNIKSAQSSDRLRGKAARGAKPTRKRAHEGITGRRRGNRT